MNNYDNRYNGMNQTSNYFDMNGFNNFDRDYDGNQYPNTAAQQMNFNRQSYNPLFDSQRQVTQDQLYANIQSQQSNIVVVQPKNFSEIQNAIKALRTNQSVIMNFSKVPKEMIQRILDFMSGAIYGICGSMQRISDSLFIFTPKGMKIQIPAEIIAGLKKK